MRTDKLSDKLTTSKHTAGPWHLLHKTGTGKFLVVGPNDDQPGDRLIADCYADSAFDLGLPSTIEAAANARLIAAAPELLAALQAAFAELDAYWQGDYAGRPLARQMLAAIAKAEGRDRAATSGESDDRRQR